METKLFLVNKNGKKYNGKGFAYVKYFGKIIKVSKKPYIINEDMINCKISFLWHETTEGFAYVDISDLSSKKAI